jgi:hypothetical protein
MIENNLIEEEVNGVNKEVEEIVEKVVEEKPKKRKGQSRERMLELHTIRSEKARLKRQEREDLLAKEEMTKNIIKEKINADYEDAQKIKQALEEKKSKKAEIKQEVKEMKHTYKNVSRDILKEKYLEEARRRVMADLFS